MHTGKKDRDVFFDITQLGFKTTRKSGNTVLFELDEKDGYGKMLVNNLYPGINIYYNDYNTTNDFGGSFDMDNYLELSYSHEGTYEFELKDNRCIYIGEGEFIALHNIFESLHSRFPQQIFKGFAITFDIVTVNKLLQGLFRELAIDINTITGRLCGDSKVYVLKEDQELQSVLEKIYQADPYSQAAYIKVKVLELLHLLSNGTISDMKHSCRYYEKNTVLKVKHIKDHLTEELTRHMTIDQLSKEHNLTKTMLKTCFKDIYGLPPYEYLKKTRMNHAAVLLRQEKYSISEVAGLVGYQNASKFSSAFKNVIGMSPREYAKQY